MRDELQSTVDVISRLKEVCKNLIYFNICEIHVSCR